VTNNASFTANGAGGAITIGNEGNNADNFGTLTFNSVGDVYISEDGTSNGMDITGTNTGTGLVLIAETGTIEDNPGTSITVDNNASFTANGAGGAIIIGDNASDHDNFGTLTFNSGGDVSISEDSSTQVYGYNTADNLALTSEQGSVTDSLDTTILVANDAMIYGYSGISLANDSGDWLSVGGNADFESDPTNGGDITVGSPGTVNFGTLTFNTPADVTIYEDSNTTTTGSNTGTTVLVVSAGNINLGNGILDDGQITGDTVTLDAANSILDGNDTVPDNQSMNITATIATVLMAETGTVGLTGNGIEVNTPTLAALAGGYDAGLTSININGTVGDGVIHFLAYPPGMVRLNGYYIGQILVPGSNSLAYPDALASAQRLVSVTGVDPMLPPLVVNTAGSVKGSAYPTLDVNTQISVGGGTVGMADPVVRVNGAGMALPENLSSNYPEPEDELRRRIGL
jgi:fibronectin-binding autotransporter adhesin